MIDRLEDRSADIMSEMLEMHDGDDAEVTEHERGSFDNAEWLAEELKAVDDLRSRVGRNIIRE